MNNFPKILVTGAAGQLGSEFRQLVKSSPEFTFVFLTRDELTIENEQSVDQVFRLHRPDYCINCAAYTAVDKAEEDKEQAFLINAKAVGILAKACEIHGSKLIHFSTDYVFDGTATEPYTEDAATNPVNAYGASKLAGEQQALAIHSPVIIIRTSWVYSAFGRNFVKTMLSLLKQKTDINVVNDQFGSPTYAADLANATMHIIAGEQWTPGIYHYCNQGIISWFDFAKAIREFAGLTCKINPIPTQAYPTPAKRPGYSALDTTKIKTVYHIPLRNWRESLQRCLQQLT
jgi:dTDP-4-dehydrorhamnose reductase